jgi:hypothetical protein
MAPVVGFPAVAESACAGRVVPNASCGVPKVVCGNTHAELVVAHTGVALADVNFADANASLGTIQVLFRLGLALSLQLVRFACSGFSLTWGTDHLLVDSHGLTPQAAAKCLGGDAPLRRHLIGIVKRPGARRARTRQQYCRRTRGRWNGGAGGRA